jgi:hypothetical protein
MSFIFFHDAIRRKNTGYNDVLQPKQKQKKTVRLVFYDRHLSLVRTPVVVDIYHLRYIDEIPFVLDYHSTRTIENYL